MPITLPAALVNPLDLRYVGDDVHVIAFFSGHPHYECVEAMLSARSDGTCSVRAILTGHDQRQVDHVNDEGLLAMAAHSDRTTVRCDVDVTLDLDARLPRAEVRFRSQRDEPVVLSVACASPPDPARGGLTDPGDHALDSSLPIMLRGASAMAAPSSRVTIAGTDYAIPEQMRAGPHFVAHRGYFTRRFHMAAIRSGTRSLRIVHQPDALALGERWVYDTPAGRQVYEIVSRDADGRLAIRSTSGQSETVQAFATTTGLVLTEVILHSPRDPREGVAVAFVAHDAFAIRIDDHATAITGSALQTAPDEVTLQPQQPAWAAKRAVRIRWHRTGDLLTVETVRAAA